MRRPVTGGCRKLRLVPSITHCFAVDDRRFCDCSAASSEKAPLNHSGVCHWLIWHQENSVRLLCDTANSKPLKVVGSGWREQLHLASCYVLAPNKGQGWVHFDFSPPPPPPVPTKTKQTVYGLLARPGLGIRNIASITDVGGLVRRFDELYVEHLGKRSPVKKILAAVATRCEQARVVVLQSPRTGW